MSLTPRAWQSAVQTLLIVAVICFGSAHSPALAQDASVDILASFAPNALDPSHQQFTNNTPQGGICVRWGGHCRAGQFSISTPLRVTSRALGGQPGNPRANYFMAVDAGWKEVEVVHSSGSRAIVHFRLSMLGQVYRRTNSGSPSAYGASSGGCSRLGTDVGNSSWHAWGWVLPARPLSCSRRTNHSSASSITIDEISIGYELRTPSPLTMLDGGYTGTLAYTVGPGAQIDLGDGTHVQTSLTVNFQLTVAHDFRVRFPSDNPSVRLSPEGGWSQWVDHGRTPTRLRQELPFHLTTSMDFSMKLRCEHDAPGDRCGIRNAAADAVVPVDVDVTIPGKTNLRDGRPAQFTPLTPVDANAPRFTSPDYIQDRRSVLRFVAGQAAVTEMVKSPGSQWQGDITVVFDANP